MTIHAPTSSLGEDALLMVNISVSLPTVSVAEDLEAGAFWMATLTRDGETLVSLTLVEVGGADPGEVIDAQAAAAVARVAQGCSPTAKEFVVVEGIVTAEGQNPALLLAHVAQWATILLKADALRWSGHTLPLPVMRFAAAKRIQGGYRIDEATARAHIAETRALLGSARRGLRLVS